jgi:excisionase family DNA binding protein
VKQRLLTVKQLSEETGVPTGTIYHLVERGKLATIRFTNSTRAGIRIREDDWQACVERSRKPAETEGQSVDRPTTISDLPGADRYAH